MRRPLHPACAGMRCDSALWLHGRLRAVASAGLALLLGACSSLAPPAPPPSPPAAPSPPATPAAAYVAMVAASPGPAQGGQTVVLPAPRQRLKAVALQEWAVWGRSRWQLQANTFERPAASAPGAEHQPDLTSRVLHYWYSFKNGRDFPAERSLYKDGSLLPWSAVFISYLMKTSGIPGELFPPSESHWNYIRAALESPSPRGFEALDAALQPPQDGDLICAPREADPARNKNFAQLQKMTRKERDQGWPYHCDLVVAVTDATVEALGGNVNESVVLTVAARDARGLLLPTADRPWTVVLRNHLP